MGARLVGLALARWAHVSDPLLGSGRMPLGVVAAYTPHVLAGVAGDPHDLALPAPLHQHRVPDGVGQLSAALVERGFGAAVGADGCCDGVVAHGPSVADTHVAKQGLRATRSKV